jgi:hypothetical protein
MNVGINKASLMLDPHAWALPKPPPFEVAFYGANLEPTAIFQD